MDDFRPKSNYASKIFGAPPLVNRLVKVNRKSDKDTNGEVLVHGNVKNVYQQDSRVQKNPQNMTIIHML